MKRTSLLSLIALLLVPIFAPAAEPADLQHTLLFRSPTCTAVDEAAAGSTS